MMINDVIKLLLKSLHDELLTEIKIEKRWIFSEKKNFSKVWLYITYNITDRKYVLDDFADVTKFLSERRKKRKNLS